MTEILIIIMLILLNGVLSMSEIAIISSRRTFLQKEADKGNGKAKTALKLFDDPDRFLSTIQIGITAISILTGIFSGATLSDDLALLLSKVGLPLKYSLPISQTLIVIIVTYFTLILGELVPKRIGMNEPEKVATAIAKPMNIISRMASPFVKLLSKSTSLIVSIIGIKENNSKVTEEEIMSMVKEGRLDGEVQEVEEDIMERVFMLGDLKVESIMTHRSEVVSISNTLSHDEIIALIKENDFDTYPIYSEEEDSIIGVVTFKELALELIQKDFKLENIISKPIYIPENLSVYKALETMKEKCVTELMVCDEFGALAGVITLRDIMEGLVGNIDENPNEQSIVKRSEKEEWLIDGQIPFYDFLSHFEKEELYDEAPYNTLAGLILNKLEHIPTAGEKLEWNIFKLEIVDMDGARIDKVSVSLLPEK
ncbi:MAG: HlyC/CorC family transporter [Bacteroidales bacterium]|nr:HlyC/CorC family transporter [Bacteroidales bacterium]